MNLLRERVTPTSTEILFGGAALDSQIGMASNCYKPCLTWSTPIQSHHTKIEPELLHRCYEITRLINVPRQSEKSASFLLDWNTADNTHSLMISMIPVLSWCETIKQTALSRDKCVVGQCSLMLRLAFRHSCNKYDLELEKQVHDNSMNMFPQEANVRYQIVHIIKSRNTFR